MPIKEIIELNKLRGYIYIGSFNYKDIYKRVDITGCNVYYLDAGYEELFPIWSDMQEKELLELVLQDLKI